MNSNGSGRNATCFENQIHQSSSLSPKSHRGDTSRPQSRYSTIISIGVFLRLPRRNYDSSSRKRFDIDDRKGLEIVMLTALLTFQDSNDQYHSPREELPLPPIPATAPKPPPLLRNASASTAAPTPPPKPAPKTGLARITEMQMLRGEYNEIIVEEEGKVEDYAQYCWNLLQVTHLDHADNSELTLSVSKG